MGGGNKTQGTTNTTQTQQTQTNPWDPTQPYLKELLSSYGGLSTDVTPEQKAALDKLTGSAGLIPSFGDPASGAVNKAFNFSTQPQIGMLSEGFGDLQNRLGATADGQNLDPYKTPGFGTAIDTMTQDILNKTKGVYAGSGRDPSGAGSFAQSFARGAAQGIAPVIQSQANINTQNMTDAAKTLYGAANTTGAQQAQLGIQEIGANMGGVSAVPSVSAAYTNPGQTALTAAQAQYALPWSNLGMMKDPLVQIAGLGGQSSGTSNQTQVQQQPQSTASNIMGGILGGAALWPTLMGSGAGSVGAAGLLPSLFALSDERVKDDIEPIGLLHDGQNVYRFRYKGDPKFHIGLLAQEAEQVTPHSVAETDEGIKMVNLHTATERAAEMARAA